MACALLFFAPGNNQLWRVAEWLVRKANSELKAVADREAVAVLPAAVVVESPEAGVAKVAVVVEVSQAVVGVVEWEAVTHPLCPAASVKALFKTFSKCCVTIS